MRPNRIYMKNFMLHKMSEIDCTQFQTALIVGKKKKDERFSNGVGKSSIFNAIEYALFNKSFATNLDGIVKEGKRKAIVEFDFELDKELYRIYRSRTSSGTGDLRLYQFIGSKWEPIGGRTPSETEKVLQELIKIKHKSFESSVLFRQAHLTGLSTKDPKERKELLKEPLDLAPYTKLEAIAAAKTKPIRKQVDTIEKAVTYLGDPEEKILNSRTELDTVLIDIQKKQQTVDGYTQNIENTQKAIDELKSSLQGKDSDIQSKIEFQSENIKRLQKQIKNINESIVNTSSTINSYDNEVLELNKKLAESVSALSDLRSVNVKSVIDLKSSLGSMKEKEKQGNEVIADINAEIKLAKRTIPEGDFCPECEQLITKEHRHNKKLSAETEINKKQKELEDFTSKLVKVQAIIKNIEQEIEDVKIHSRKIESLNDQVSRIESDIEFRKSYIYTHKPALDSHRKSLKESTDDLQAAMVIYEELKELAKENNIENINIKINSLNSELHTYKKTLKAFNSELSDLKRREGALKERIERCEQDKKQLAVEKDKLAELKQNLYIHQMVQSAFSHKGIPTFIIQNILNELQFETNNVLKELRPELEIRLDGELNIEYRRNGQARAYGQLSHGQHCYIALAFKQGFARVIQKKVGVQLNLLEFDEVDSPLDDAGIDAFVDVVRKWQKDFKIFIITHNKELKDKFSHAILVEEGDDGSEARVVTSW